MSEAAAVKLQPPGRSGVVPAVPAASARATPGYVPAIDGFRAVAILLVLTGHFGLGFLVPGGFGVTIFFLISGLLITRLLLIEHDRSGRIQLLNFYARRFARLAPALLAFIVIVTAIYAATHAVVPWGEVVASLFYVENYYRIAYGSTVTPLGILWSLAVEEHYYFIFPAAFALLLMTRQVLPVLVAALVAGLVWRTVLLLGLHVSDTYTYMATDARFDSILYGALLAVLLHRGADAAPARFLTSPLAFAAGVVVIVGTLVIRNPVLRETIRYSLQGLALMPIVAAVVFGDRSTVLNGARALLATRPLVFIGKLSYSLYLWHYACIDGVKYLMPDGSGATRLVVSASLAIITSLASYFLVERSFMALRHRLGSHAR